MLRSNTVGIADLTFGLVTSGNDFPLENVIIPDGVKVIGRAAFSGSPNLKSVTIPASVTRIGVAVFTGCSGLTSISVQEGNTVYHSTDNCLIETNSKTLWVGCQNSVIPTDGSVQKIGDYAFSGCDNIKSITIPNGVTSIREWAFMSCDCLTSITIPDSVTSIGYGAFLFCNSLTDVHYFGTKDQWQAIEIEDVNDPLSTATIHCTDGDIVPEQ